MTSLVVTTNIKTVKHASWYVSETKNNRKRKHNVNIGQREREREREGYVYSLQIITSEVTLTSIVPPWVYKNKLTHHPLRKSHNR